MRKHCIPVPPSLTTVLLGAVFLVGVLPGAFAMQMSTSIARPPKPDLKATKPEAKAAAKSSAELTTKPETELLPSSFSGWEADSATKPLTDAAQADPTNAAALKEYGFTDALLRDYIRDGETLKIRALRFIDASGAYGAYSFYRQSGWPKEEVGTGAASNHGRVLFWIGNVVVDSQFPHISAMSASELRELAAAIPLPAGNKSLIPPILADLPQKDMDGQTTHYALGPAGYTGPVASSGPTSSADSTGVLPPNLVGFDRGAETAAATYKLRSGLATLTIINYPTPQMAAVQEKAIADYLKAGNTPQHPFTRALQDSNPAALAVRRSGPLVAVVSGDPIPDEARKLLDSVHYEADTSPIPGQANNDVQKTAQLLLAIVTLVVVMFVAAVLLALFLGGGRAIYRFARGKPISSVYDEEFTRLDLGDR